MASSQGQPITNRLPPEVPFMSANATERSFPILPPLAATRFAIPLTPASFAAPRSALEAPAVGHTGTQTTTASGGVSQSIPPTPATRTRVFFPNSAPSQVLPTTPMTGSGPRATAHGLIPSLVSSYNSSSAFGSTPHETCPQTFAPSATSTSATSMDSVRTPSTSNSDHPLSAFSRSYWASGTTRNTKPVPSPNFPDAALFPSRYGSSFDPRVPPVPDGRNLREDNNNRHSLPGLPTSGPDTGNSTNNTPADEDEETEAEELLDEEVPAGAICRPGGEPYLGEAERDKLLSKKRKGRYLMYELGLIIEELFHPTRSLQAHYDDAMASGGGVRPIFHKVRFLGGFFWFLSNIV